MDTKEEKEAWEELMCAINNMGSITSEPISVFYKRYHKTWNILIDRARIYRRVAKLDEKYNLNEV